MEIFWGVISVLGLLVLIQVVQHLKGFALAFKLMVDIHADIGEMIMGKLDTLNAALQSIDDATTELADQLAALAERVTADDISPAELQAAVDKAAGLADRISDAATSVAGVEAADTPLPDPIPDPVEEVPSDETPDDGGVPDDGTVVDPGVPADGGDTFPTEPPADGGTVTDGTGDGSGVIGSDVVEGETTPVAEPGSDN